MKFSLLPLALIGLGAAFHSLAAEEGSGADAFSVPSLALPSSENQPILEEAPSGVLLPDNDMDAATQAAAGQAQLAFQAGKWAEASGFYTEALRRRPEDARLMAGLGVCLYREGKFDEAFAQLRRSVLRTPDEASGWTTLGLLLSERGRGYEAISALAQAVALSPKNAEAHSHLGVALARQGWFAAAEGEFRRAVELNPSFAKAQFNLALMCLERQPPAVELARRHYQAALELGAPRDSEVEGRLATFKSP